MTPIYAKICGDMQRGRRMKAVKTLCEKVAPVQRKKMKKKIIFGHNPKSATPKVGTAILLGLLFPLLGKSLYHCPIPLPILTLTLYLTEDVCKSPGTGRNQGTWSSFENRRFDSRVPYDKEILYIRI